MSQKDKDKVVSISSVDRKARVCLDPQRGPHVHESSLHLKEGRPWDILVVDVCSHRNNLNRIEGTVCTESGIRTVRDREGASVRKPENRSLQRHCHLPSQCDAQKARPRG